MKLAKALLLHLFSSFEAVCISLELIDNFSYWKVKKDNFLRRKAQNKTFNLPCYKMMNPHFKRFDTRKCVSIRNEGKRGKFDEYLQPTIICLKLTIETPEQGVKYVQTKQIKTLKQRLALLILNIFHILL